MEDSIGELKVAVRSMPDSVIHTMDGMVDGARRLINKPGNREAY